MSSCKCYPNPKARCDHTLGLGSLHASVSCGILTESLQWGTESPILQMSKLRLGDIWRAAQITQGIKGRLGDEAASLWGLTGVDSQRGTSEPFNMPLWVPRLPFGDWQRQRKPIFLTHPVPFPWRSPTLYPASLISTGVSRGQLLNSHHGPRGRGV